MVTTAAGPARFFAVIGVHAVYALIALAAVVVLGVVAVWMNETELDSGLGMILFAQMFLASSGFLVRARQGHYDPLLTCQSARKKTIAAHWGVSIAPGIAAWLLVAGAGALAGSPTVFSAIAGSRAAGLVIVSAVSWSLGFALPRGAAGMLWTALLMVLVTQRAELLAASAGPPQGVAAWVATLVRDAATLIVCPFLLLGRPAVAPGAVAGAVLLSVAPLLFVWHRADVLDIYLEGRA